MGSYCLCTAIDEAASRAPWGKGTGADPGPWAKHQLAAQFHLDTEGGVKVFYLLNYMTEYQSQHVDFLDLVHRILGLGFVGLYGNSGKGMRMLYERRYKLGNLVKAVSEDAAENLAQAQLAREAAAIQPHKPYRVTHWIRPTLRTLLDVSPAFLLVAALVWGVLRVLD